MQVKIISFFFLCLLFLMAPNYLCAEMRSINKIRIGLPPYEVVPEMIRSNQEKVKEFSKFRKNTAIAPTLTWLATSSPSIQPDSILHDFNNRIYPVRNLGPLLSTSLVSMDYGIRTLRTPVLLITAEIDKQAVGEVLKSYEKTDKNTYKELAYLEELAKASSLQKDIPPSHSDSIWRNIIEKYVDYLVGLAIKRYHNRIKDGRLVAIGSILDTNNVYGRGAGSLLIININGENDETRIKQLQATKKLNVDMLLHVGRTPILTTKKESSTNQ